MTILFTEYDYNSELIIHQRNVHGLNIDLPVKQPRKILKNLDDPESEVQPGNTEFLNYKKNQKMDLKATVPCEVCGKNINRARIKYHLNRVHFKQKPLACDKCGKTFLFKNEMTSHVK